MKILNVINFVILFYCFGCKNMSNSQAQTNKKYFKDLNLFEMKGYHELSSVQYPCISIDSISEDSILIEYLHNRGSYGYSYKKYPNYWLAIKSLNEDDGSITHVYEFVFPTRIVTHFYNNLDSPSIFRLSNVEIFQISGQQNFTSPIELIQPSLKYREFQPDFFSNRIEDDFILHDEILEVIYNRGSEVEHRSCYPLDGHSIFWWRAFAPLIEKVPCQ